MAPLLKDRRLSVKKVLKIAELVRFRPLALVPSSSMASILCKTAQHFSHGMLGFHELGHHRSTSTGLSIAKHIFNPGPMKDSRYICLDKENICSKCFQSTPIT